MSGRKSNDVAATFQAMVEGDREKRKNQAIADMMFGSGRRSSAPGGLTNRGGFTSPRGRGGLGGSLASRVGITKQTATRPIPTAPKTGINGKWAHDLHKTDGPKRTASSSHLERGNKLLNAMQRDTVVNKSSPQFHIRNSSGAQLSIKGQANPGPFVVVATNFAAGTTSDDIKMAFEPHGDDLLSCKIVASRPQVTAEAVFAKKDSAENVVAMFNNSMADGNLLYVFVKSGQPSPIHNLEMKSNSVQTTPAARSPARHSETVIDPPKYEEAPTPTGPRDEAMMDVDDSARPRKETARPLENNTRREDSSRRQDDSRNTGRGAHDSYQRRNSGGYHPNGYGNPRYAYSNRTPSYDRRGAQDFRMGAAYNARPRYQSYGSGYGR